MSHYLALQGVLSMAQARGYVAQPGNPELVPPPTNIKKFFRCFPAYFDLWDPSYHERVRIEFWDKSLGRIIGRKRGRRFWPSITNALKRKLEGGGLTLRMIFLVVNYTDKQVRVETRHARKKFGCHIEVFRYQFFGGIHKLPQNPIVTLVRNREEVARLRHRYGLLSNLPKLSTKDFMARYLNAQPGDVVDVVYRESGKRDKRYVVPSTKKRKFLTDKVFKKYKEKTERSKDLSEYYKAMKEKPL